MLKPSTKIYPIDKIKILMHPLNLISLIVYIYLPYNFEIYKL